MSSVDLVKTCLARINETDETLEAWVHLDTDHALEQASELDLIRQQGRPIGPLHGVPVGLKDIIDTIDFPTERGTPIHAGRQPYHDAAIVERLRDAGAVILGKTKTTEFAFMHPTDTRNPQDMERTPGGSSSGSACAVAANHVPLAIGTQTNGSVIRPASFCGTFGFKPTRGVISRRGILQTSKTLDQVGVFSRSLEDAALLVDAVKGYDPSDSRSYPRPRPAMLAGCRSEAPVEPELVWFDLPFNDRLSEDAGDGISEILDILTELGAKIERMAAPGAFAGLVEVQRIIHEYEICQHLEKEFAENWDKLSTSLQPTIERGRSIRAVEYVDALATMASANKFFDGLYKDYDVVIAPSAAGEAPAIASGTGDPVFCTLWTLCGLPCVNLPLLVGGNGLPIGVQIIGAAEEDDRLLRTANWVLEKLKQAEAG